MLGGDPKSAAADRRRRFTPRETRIHCGSETAEAATGVESFGAPRALRIGVRLATP
jgi:hypothetical protein